MKEFKLTAWPDLAAPFHRTMYRRMLSDMSHRYMTLAALVAASGASKPEVRQFLEMLTGKGLLDEREAEPDSFFDSLRPMGSWFRRTVLGEETQY